MRAHIMAILFFALATIMLFSSAPFTTDQRVAFWGFLTCSQVWGAAAFLRESK